MNNEIKIPMLCDGIDGRDVLDDIADELCSNAECKNVKTCSECAFNTGSNLVAFIRQNEDNK